MPAANSPIRKGKNLSIIEEKIQCARLALISEDATTTCTQQALASNNTYLADYFPSLNLKGDGLSAC